MAAMMMATLRSNYWLKKARAATQSGRPRETNRSVQCDNTEFPDASAAMANSATLVPRF